MSSARRCRAVCVQYQQFCSSAFQQLQTPRLTGNDGRWTVKSRGPGGREKSKSNNRGHGCHRHRTAIARQYSTSFSTTSTSTTTTTSQSPSTEHAPPPTRPLQYPNTGEGVSTSTSTSTTISSPINPTAAHHDLASFLAHAHRTGLSTSSTVYNGTLYEYVAQETLRRHGFELHRVGGRGDRGVDLVGFWRVPKKSRETSVGKEGEEKEQGVEHDDDDVLRVIVQCKRLSGKHAKIGPNLVRELDGAVRGARLGFLFDSLVPRAAPATNDDTSIRNESTSTSTASGDRDPKSELDSAGSDTSPASLKNSSSSSTNIPAIGVLVGTRPATKGVIESLRRSNRGLVWIMLEEVVDSSVNLAQDALGRTASITDGQQPITNTDAEADTDAESSSESIATALASTPPPPPRGRVKQIIWNQAARNLGLEGVDVVKRYISLRREDDEEEEAEGEEKEREEEVVLSRAGRPLYPVSVL